MKTDKTRKNKTGDEKAGGKGPKAVVSASKAAVPASKATVRASKAPIRVSKAAVEGTKAIKRPQLATIALVAPARRGRTVNNLKSVLERIETRLLLAWQYRSSLLPGLPKRPAFFEHAWSAYDVLNDNGADEGSQSAEANNALTALLEQLVLLRSAVTRVTEPGDVARETLRTSTKLEATHGMVAVAREILDGARTLQERFPSLTDGALERAEKAYVAARTAVSKRRAQKVTATVGRAANADNAQLALDVLIDSMDQLAAAAITQLSHDSPLVAEKLAAALEHKSAGGAASDPTAGAAAAGGDAAAEPKKA